MWAKKRQQTARSRALPKFPLKRIPYPRRVANPLIRLTRSAGVWTKKGGYGVGKTVKSHPACPF